MSDTRDTLGLDTILIRNPQFVLREEEDDAAILFDPDTGAVRLLNSTAVAFWKAVDGQRAFSELIESVKIGFEGIDADADEQLQDLAGQLYAAGAVGIRTDTAGGRA